MDDYKKRTIETYNRNVLSFAERFNQLTNIHRQEEFQKFVNYVPDRGRVLDIGCGSGEVSLYFSQQGLEMTCIDLSEEMAKLTKQKGLNVLLMDMEDLAFKDDYFDGIWAVASLLHLKKSRLPPTIENISRITKPGGTFYTCLKKGEGERFIDGRFFAFWQKDELEYSLYNYFDLIEFKQTKFGNTIFLEYFLKNGESDKFL